MPQKQHIIHGRDHCPTGADPIPCMLTGPTAVGSYTERILAEPSLLAYWPLNDLSGDAADLGPHNIDLPDRFTPTYSQPGPFPDDPALTSVQFSSDDFHRSGLDNPLSYLPVSPTELTVECWVYAYSWPASAWYGIVMGASGTYTAVGYQLQLRADGQVFFNFGGDASGQVESVATLNLDEWVHIVGVGTTTDIKALYFNGEPVAVEGPASGWTPVDNHTQIGSSETAVGGIGYWDGRICQVALYSEALDAVTIASHYTAGVESGSGDFAGQVPISDGEGGVTWGYPTKVDGTRYDGILTGTGLTSTDNGDGTVTLDAAAATPPSPADDTLVWMPLSTVTGGVPELVWEADDSLIPTLTPLA